MQCHHPGLKHIFLSGFGFPLGFGEGFDAVGWVFEREAQTSCLGLRFSSKG
jgi:hypothetical protein